MLKVSSGSDPTYESLDPVSKVVNWSQHPLQDPIHKGRSVFKQSPGIIGIEAISFGGLLPVALLTEPTGCLMGTCLGFLFPEILGKHAMYEYSKCMF